MKEQSDTPSWWRCDTHGPGTRTAWGCPECVRELRTSLTTATRERDEARAEVKRLLGVLLDQVPHAYEGNCPDSLDPTQRDPNCRACQLLAATEAKP